MEFEHNLEAFNEENGPVWQHATEGQPLFGIEEENSAAITSYLASANEEEEEDEVESEDEDAAGDWGNVDPQTGGGNEPSAPGSAV